MSMLRETHHEKICLHLLENGGEATHSSLGDWAGTTLGMATQDFSDLAEGMVEEGLLRWDGTILSLHSEGRALGAKVKARSADPAPAAAGAKKGKKKKVEPAASSEAKPAPIAAEDAPAAAKSNVVAPAGPTSAKSKVVAPAGPAAAESNVVAPAERAADPVVAPVAAASAEDRGHDHGHSHDHGHDHGHAAPAAEQAPRPPRAKASEPKAAPPRGLLGRLRCRIKKLLGR